MTAVSLGAPFDDGAGLQVGGADAQPRVISQSYPQYPYDLVHASIVGEVLVDFYIKTDGTAGNAVAILATDVRFAEAALAAIRQWSFAPGKKNGRLVTTHVQQQIGFVLHD